MQVRKNAHLCPQQFRHDWYRDVVHRAALIGLQPVEVSKMHGGNKNDGGLLKTWMLPDHVRKLETIKLRHAYVHQHDGNVSLQQIVQRCPARLGFDEVFSQLTKDGLVAKQFARLVIYHQNVDFFLLRHPAPSELDESPGSTPFRNYIFRS